MMKLNKLEYLEELSIMGVGFYIDVPDVGTLCLPVQDVPEFEKDGVRYIAKRYGVSIDVFRAWMEADRNVQCSAVTRSGSRCKIIVEGGTKVSAKEFERMKGATCHLH